MRTLLRRRGLQHPQVLLRLADRLRGDTRETRNLQAEASVRRSGGNLVQEHDLLPALVAKFRCVEMRVDARGQLLRERRQLEVVGCEQREALVPLREMTRDGPCERKAVERRCTAADLVDQHQ